MKKSHLLIPLFLLLSSCGIHNPIIDRSSASEQTSDSAKQDRTSVEDPTSNSGTPFVSSDDSFSAPKEKEGSVQFYSLNDFHGATEEKGYEAGILKVGSFFKEKRKEANTVLLNSGDMFQGSLLSNSNHGEFLTKVMNDIQFDCFTLGNHEFDWGQEVIRNLNSLKDETTSYKTPFLAANIYQYDMDNDRVGNYANLGERYTTKVLSNSIKVGIIGFIGENQITSITSTYVDDLTFLDPISVTKELSDELRTKEKCDIVVLDIHASQEDVLNKGITSTSPISKKRYVDAVFCAHSHQREKAIENGVPFIQAGYNGQSYADVKLNLDKNGNVSLDHYDYPYTSSISVTNDPDIVSLYSEYSAKVNGEEVLGTLSGKLSKGCHRGNNVSALVCKALFWASQNKGNNYSIDYTFCNTSRAALSSRSITYEALYKALPFDNEIYIGTCKGSEIASEASYNSFYRIDTSALEDDKTYTIAIIDYLATHRNSNRKRDYFPSFQRKGILKNDLKYYTYREITKDYIKSLGSITASDYSSSKKQFDLDMLYQSIA